MLNTFQPYNLDLLGVRLPEIVIDESEKTKLGLDKNASNLEYLSLLCNRGFDNKILNKKIDPKKSKEYAERCKSELQTFAKLNLVDYVLLVHDVLSWCDKQSIPKGPGRGCLSGDSKVLINGRYHLIKDAFIGKTINCKGKIDDIIALHKYECSEKLVRFKTYYSTPYSPSFTKDHKILCLKNPFGKRGTIKQGVKNLQNKLHLFDSKSLEWVPANKIDRNDYLVRYVGRQSECVDIDVIDLAPFSDKYDENYVYEQHDNNNFNPLNIRTISLSTGLCRNYLLSLKRKKNVKFRHAAKRKIFDDYLLSINKTFDDFLNNSFYYTKKYDRYLKITDSFCYVLGFYIGDGWTNNTNIIGLAFHSENNAEQLELIKSYFCNHLTRCQLHKNRKLIQFYIKSKIFSRLFKNLVPNTCNTKKIPNFFLNLPDNKLKELFNGLIASDGCIRIEDGALRKSFDNTSIELIYQFRQIAEYFGYICSISKRNQERCSESYKVTFQERKKCTSTGYNDGKYVYIKVRDIEEVDSDGYVYDLSVRENPSYHTDNFIVHNSAAGSCVLFLIGCTQIDSVKHNLSFTRFISEARAQSKVIDGIVYLNGRSLCDIDNDVGYYRRLDVIKYIENRFLNKTSKIGTQSCLTGKILIKETSKAVLEYSEEQAKQLSDLIEKHFGVIEDLEETYKNSNQFKKWVDSSLENKECFKIAKSLSSLIKNRGIHPSGMALSYEPINGYIPLELSSSKEITSSYNMEEVANLAVKLDVLGLKTIDVINETCQLLNIKPDDIDINHQSIYDFLSKRQEFYGLFQIEEGLSKKVIVDVKPKNIIHLCACISISRPGALAYIKDYVKFVNLGEIKPFHPAFDKVLEDTGNIIIYQEQITKICEQVYKLDPISADQVRYGVGKKKRDEIKKWEAVVKQQGIKNGIPEDVTDKFWDIINKSADYLFCENHGLSYSYITAQTTYLKANHPKEFFISLLRMAKFEPNPIEVISKINQELRHFGITLLPPHILHSDIDFKVIGENIMFGLGSIKGVSEKTIEKLNKFRHPHSNKFEIFIGAKEAGLSIGQLCSLISVGSLDDLIK